MTQPNLVRFQPPGPRDEPRVSAYCAWCGGEIYVGEAVSVYASGDKTHDGRCEDEYVRAETGLERTIAE